MGDTVLHLLAELREPVVPKNVEAGHHVDQVADVGNHRVAEDERLALAVLGETFGNAFHRLAEAPVEIAHGVVQALLDLALDAALDPLGVVAREFRHEVVRVRHGHDAVADPELALQRLLRRVVPDAEELAEVEPGPVDVVVVVLDEAGAPAHHALPEPLHQLGVGLVVGDGEQPRALVVPGKRVGVVLRAGFAHGRGERGEGGLGQEALVVAPGARGRVVVGGDVVGGLAVVEPAGPGGDAQGHQHGVVGEVHGRCLPGERCHWVRAAAQRMKASVCWRAGSRRTQEPTRNSPTSRLSLMA